MGDQIAQIDALVRSIRHALAEPSQPETETALTDFIHALGVGGPRQAIALREVLERWAEDMNSPPDVRAYALQQLASLPDF